MTEEKLVYKDKPGHQEHQDHGVNLDRRVLLGLLGRLDLKGKVDSRESVVKPDLLDQQDHKGLVATSVNVEKAVYLEHLDQLVKEVKLGLPVPQGPPGLKETRESVERPAYKDNVATGVNQDPVGQLVGNSCNLSRC